MPDAHAIVSIVRQKADHVAEGGARPRPRLVISIIVVGLVAGWLVPVVTNAHGGPARIVLEPSTVRPGGTVVVRGEDLSADDVVVVAIAGRGVRVELESELTDGEGHFVQAIVIPYEIAEGSYRIEAKGSVGAVVGAELVVFGSPVDPVGGGGGRDEDDPLLIPLPPGWQQSLSSPSVTATPVTAGREAGIDVPLPIATLLAVGAFGAGAIVVTLIARRRPSA